MDSGQSVKFESIENLINGLENSVSANYVVSLLLIVVLVMVIQQPSFLKRLFKLMNSTSGADGQSLARWDPVPFERPVAQPYPGWNIHTTKPIPYRPFRYGPYYITMGIRRMQWDEWIELDNQYFKYHARKVERIAQRGAHLSCTAPEAFNGACELLEELCAYLPQRYPSLFRKTAIGMDNLCTGETFNITERPLVEDPMQMAARMIQDDIALMFERPDGEYYLLAATVILPGAWRLKDKFGMSLSDIHITGHVPGYKTKLEKGMMNFFRRVQPQSPVIRNNYYFQMGDDLAWNHSLGPENFDEINDKDGDHTKTVKHQWSAQGKDKTIELQYFRSERQTLRRLPRTGAIVFIFRSYLHPVTEIAQESGVPGRLASAVRSWGADVAKYKGRANYEDVLLKYLDQKHKEQVEQGIVDETDLKEKDAYPY